MVRTKLRMPSAEKHLLSRFYLLAFAWTWALWIPPLVWSARTGQSLPTMEAGLAVWSSLDGVGRMLALWFQLAVYGPLLAALALLLHAACRGEDANLRRWMANLRRLASPRWWIFVATWPVALGAVVLLAASLTGGGAPRLAALPPMLAWPVLLGVQLMTSGMEEPGWRGFALPLLQRAHDAENASWYLGLMWAAWHLPYVIYLNRAAPLWTLPLTIAGFTMSIVGMGYVHAWVFNSTESLPLNIALHAWANVTNTVVAAVQPSSLVPIATAGATWLFVAWLLRRYGKQTLSATRRAAAEVAG